MRRAGARPRRTPASSPSIVEHGPIPAAVRCSPVPGRDDVGSLGDLAEVDPDLGLAERESRDRRIHFRQHELLVAAEALLVERPSARPSATPAMDVWVIAGASGRGGLSSSRYVPGDPDGRRGEQRDGRDDRSPATARAASRTACRRAPPLRPQRAPRSSRTCPRPPSRARSRSRRRAPPAARVSGR